MSSSSTNDPSKPTIYEPVIAPHNSQIFRFEVDNYLHTFHKLDTAAIGTSYDPCPYFFSARGCTLDAHCPWRHTDPPVTVCKHYLRGLCKKQAHCPYLHSVDKSRMPHCFFYSKYGQCHNDDCVYRHVDRDTAALQCPYFARGFCRHGAGCRLRHVERVACANYLAGFCILGPQCEFGHAKMEVDSRSGGKDNKDQPMSIHHPMRDAFGSNGA